jgi:hypothetical protein
VICPVLEALEKGRAMGRAAVLQGVRQMRFEALLDRRERGELNQECWGSRSGHFAAGATGGAMKGGQG